jgi:hypothetical protein
MANGRIRTDTDEKVAECRRFLQESDMSAVQQIEAAGDDYFLIGVRRRHKTEKGQQCSEYPLMLCFSVLPQKRSILFWLEHP